MEAKVRFFKGLQRQGKDDRVRWALMSSYDIPCGNRLYLRRLRLIQTPWFGIFLHETWHRDQDRDPHDHPWTFWTFVLKGGYEEIVVSPDRSYRRSHPRFSFKHLNKTWFHRIIELHNSPTWTLMFVGPRTREWGFLLPDDSWQVWHEYKETNG